MANKPAVTLTIAGDADALSRATKQATGSVDTMNDHVTKQSRVMGDEAEKHSGRMSEAMGLAGAAVGGFAVMGGKHLFDLSKSMESLDVKARTVFEGELPAIQAWAEQNRKAFGDSTRNVVAMAANLADLLKPMGFTAAQAGEMSKKILDLSGALSRWSGGTKTAAEVSEILADAMLGETDSLKGLGISISAAEIDAKALSMGLGKTTVDMSRVREATLGVEKAQRALNDAINKHGKGSLEARDAAMGLEKAQGAVKDAMAGGKAEISDQAKALATQQLILEKSTDAQTAWANGGREAAEAQNGLSSTMAESAEKLAGIVAPVFERLVSVLGAVAEWMSKNQEAAIVIGVVTAAVWLLNLAMNANPIMILVTTIAVLVGALVYLWTTSETFRNVVTGVFRFVGDVVGNVVGWIVDRWNGMVDWFRNLPRRIGEALGSLGEIIQSAFRGGLNMAIDALNGGIRRINDLIYGVNVVNPFENIPYIPQVARLHTGGTFHSGSAMREGLAVLRDGEEVSAPGQGGGRVIELRSMGGSAADLIAALMADGQVEARFR